MLGNLFNLLVAHGSSINGYCSIYYVCKAQDIQMFHMMLIYQLPFARRGWLIVIIIIETELPRHHPDDGEAVPNNSSSRLSCCDELK